MEATINFDSLNLSGGFEDLLRNKLLNPDKVFTGRRIDLEEVSVQMNTLYRAVKGKNRWLTPLTGYAGTYITKGKKLQRVGVHYFNVSGVERDPILLPLFGASIAHGIDDLVDDDTVLLCLPYGGLAVGTAAFLNLGKGKHIFAEKITTALATGTLREQTEIALKRHRIKKGDRVIVIDDVANGFSTLDDILQMLIDAGVEIIAYACALNRSPKFREVYISKKLGIEIPIRAAINKPYPQFTQGHYLVKQHLKNGGKLILKPKFEDWDGLIAQMKQAEAALA